MKKPVGVIGSGSFGLTISSLLAKNEEVLLYTRRDAVVKAINEDRLYLDTKVDERITALTDLQHVCDTCHLIFPVVPAASFRSVMRQMAPFLRPYHIVIHATKGLDVTTIDKVAFEQNNYTRKDVFSMSEVIRDETTVLRIGCMSGPNLAREILAGQPAATVIASEFTEVIRAGQKALSSSVFSVFGSHDLKGAELAGVFKNIIAIGSGIIGGLNMGKNLQAALITRGLREMIQFGQAMGASSKSFLGTSGIGDLIATATSDKSRNYSFGKRLAAGESKQTILDTSEVVEGVRTLQIINHLAQKEGLQLPIVSILHKVVFEGLDVEKAIKILMTYNYAADVDFI